MYVSITLLYAKYIRSVFSHRKVSVLMQYSALQIQIWKKSVFSRRYCALCCASDLFYIFNCMQGAARSRTVILRKLNDLF